ncbi:RNA polymerase sigma-70 factor (ECF subfamily) [Paenibacillus endophyticus]|uniref:RNA polymerase sigma-70 factor (ECF subfamily) n=1 Tax=Paenibacillus endophyticus TaxID=1294268 RepID=A0A7W5C7Z0_9BACL|nr:sigma-70 family RNA polymerase sigma factor [Paenibacillus endophyticus]MBB3152807.1 RNA polymerase sigma-70 factor (ECF subfamily) [Paenibacillus endophyticus]
MKITEHNVVEQLLNKNEKAIAFMINQYGGLLAAIIKRHLNDQQQDYEECLDDVLLSVWQHVHSFDPAKNSFKQWAAAIAKYKAIDYQRKQITMRSRQFSVPDIKENMIHSVTLPENIIDEALEQLTPSERHIFEKYYLEGTPSSEIAQAFQAKESWVHNKLSRGRKKLKRFLIKSTEI